MPKIAFLFPGQGSQKVGMGKKWVEQFPVARETFEEASEALGFNLSDLCFAGAAAELKMTQNAQPAILTASIAAYRVFQQQFNVEPAYMAGHSLGEFSALTAAGSIRFTDAVKLVRQRGMFMQEAAAQGVGAMAAVGGIDLTTLQTWCSELSTEDYSLVISNYNAPDQLVVSGHKVAVDQLGKFAEKAGARFTPLNVSAPFHSPIMHTAASLLEQELKKYDYSDPNYPVISNVTAQPYSGKERIVPLLTEQMTKAVRWIETMDYLHAQGISTVIELGPQAVLTKLAAANAPTIEAYSFDRDDDVARLESELPCNQNTTERVPFISRCLGIAVCLKNFNDDEAEYRSGVIEPYQRLQQLAEQVEQDGSQPREDQMSGAVALLKQIMDTKKTPEAEKSRRWKQLMNDTGTHEWLGHRLDGLQAI